MTRVGRTRVIKGVVAGKASISLRDFLSQQNLSLGFLLGEIVAVRFLNALESTVFFAVFFDESAGYQILQLFVSAETEHLFATTHCITLLKSLVDVLEKLVESEKLRIGAQNIHQFVGDMIGESTGETRPFSSCHNKVRLAANAKKSD